jgi:hypothetical protein
MWQLLIVPLFVVIFVALAVLYSVAMLVPAFWLLIVVIFGKVKAACANLSNKLG